MNNSLSLSLSLFVYTYVYVYIYIYICTPSSSRKPTRGGAQPKDVQRVRAGVEPQDRYKNCCRSRARTHTHTQTHTHTHTNAHARTRTHARTLSLLPSLMIVRPVHERQPKMNRSQAAGSDRTGTCRGRRRAWGRPSCIYIYIYIYMCIHVYTHIYTYLYREGDRCM